MGRHESHRLLQLPTTLMAETRTWFFYDSADFIFGKHKGKIVGHVPARSSQENTLISHGLKYYKYSRLSESQAHEYQILGVHDSGRHLMQHVQVETYLLGEGTCTPSLRKFKKCTNAAAVG